jgi:predicted anti-sigma-YlaC factor YlaD
MHESIRNRLEDLLAARGTAGESAGLAEHLSSCPECSSEFVSMKTQSELLHSLRAPEEIEPAAGFYARVMQRIEERAKDSIWAVFIYSPFSMRVAYASLALAIMLGTYVITQESLDGHLGSGSIIARGITPVEGSQAQQRDAVLANFASRSVATNVVFRQGSPQ